MISHQCQFGRAIYYLTFSVVCFYFSAVALFQHHSDFPLFAWRADQSACPHTCRDRLYDWSKHTRAIKNEFKHTQNDHLFSLQIWLKGDYVICNNVGAFFFFFKVWKVKKAFKIQVFWKGGKPTFLVCVHVSLSVIFFFCYQKTVLQAFWSSLKVWTLATFPLIFSPAQTWTWTFQKGGKTFSDES